MSSQSLRPIDPQEARPGDLLRWSDGTIRVIVAPGLVCDDHGHTTSISDAIARWPYDYLGTFRRDHNPTRPGPRPLMRDFLRTTPVGALQFDGTDESAAAIASEFGFTLRAVYRPRPNPSFGPAAVFEYRPYVTAGPLAPLMRYKFSPGEYYEVDSDHLHTITMSAGSWIWLDRETHTIGVEWDDYFLEHYTAAPEPAGSPR